MSYKPFAVLLMLVALVGCGDASTSTSTGPTTVKVVVTNPSAPGATGVTFNNNPAFPAETTLALTATATLSDGTSRNVTVEATWTSSNSSVASVDASGTVTVHRRVNGSASIAAVFKGVSGPFQVAVAVL